jgi:hypothetical protein
MRSTQYFGTQTKGKKIRITKKIRQLTYKNIAPLCVFKIRSICFFFWSISSDALFVESRNWEGKFFWSPLRLNYMPGNNYIFSYRAFFGITTKGNKKEIKIISCLRGLLWKFKTVQQSCNLQSSVARFVFVKHTKMGKNIPNEPKIYQMTIK